MQIYKRKDSQYWSYSFTIRGNRVRRSTREDVKAKARAIAVKHYNDLSQRYGNEKPEITLDKAFGRYWLTHASKLKTANTIDGQIQVTINYFGKETLLSEIGQKEFAGFVTYLQTLNKTLSNGKVKYLSNATINRYIENYRAMFYMARDQWSYNVGDLKFKSFVRKEPPARVRYLTNKQAQELIEVSPPHLQLFIHLALFTGARKENLLSLKWDQVDFDKKTISFIVKGGKYHSIPLSSLLEQILKQQDSQCPYVISYKGNRIKDIRKAFHNACGKVGIRNFRIHDLRHTCASWLVQNGTPLEIVQLILGHSRIDMTLKYAHHNHDIAALSLEKLAQNRHKI